jgi:hypothetical protein
MACDSVHVRVLATLRTCAIVGAIAGVATGCDPDEDDSGGSSETGPDGPHTTLLVEVGPSVCDDPLVVQVQVRGRIIGCASAGPCTLPSNPEDVLGDVATCPITDERLLGLDIVESGRYLVDTIADRTPDPAEYECWAGKATETDVLVTDIDLEARGERTLVGLGVECIEPD